jgi:hypothetical protein
MEVYPHMKEADMKNRVILVCNLFSIILLISVLIFQLDAFGQRSDPAMGTAEFANDRIMKLQQTARTLRELAAQPLPAQLSDKEEREAERHTKWLKDSSQKLDELASRWHSSLAGMEKNQGALSKQIQLTEMSQSFNLQYLQLQNDLQQESRQFTLVSNIMKNKHDTAKNSINNLR